MKQRYLLSKTDTEIIIVEKAELEQGIYAELCECRFSIDDLTSAVNAGQPEVISLIRTNNMFPTLAYSQQIADALSEIVNQPPAEKPLELNFSDIDFLHKDIVVEDSGDEKAEGETDDIEGILDESLDDAEDEAFVEDDIKNIDEPTDPASVKVADGDIADLDT